MHVLDVQIATCFPETPPGTHTEVLKASDPADDSWKYWFIAFEEKRRWPGPAHTVTTAVPRPSNPSPPSPPRLSGDNVVQQLHHLVFAKDSQHHTPSPPPQQRRPSPPPERLSPPKREERPPPSPPREREKSISDMLRNAQRRASPSESQGGITDMLQRAGNSPPSPPPEERRVADLLRDAQVKQSPPRNAQYPTPEPPGGTQNVSDLIRTAQERHSPKSAERSVSALLANAQKRASPPPERSVSDMLKNARVVGREKASPEVDDDLAFLMFQQEMEQEREGGGPLVEDGVNILEMLKKKGGEEEGEGAGPGQLFDITLRTSSPDISVFTHFQLNHNMVLSNVDFSSPFFGTGLEQYIGYRLIFVDGVSVGTPGEAFRQCKKKQEVVLTFAPAPAAELEGEEEEEYEEDDDDDDDTSSDGLGETEGTYETLPPPRLYHGNETGYLFIGGRISRRALQRLLEGPEGAMAPAAAVIPISDCSKYPSKATVAAFHSPQDAEVAARKLDGRKVGSETLQVKLVWPLRGPNDKQHHIEEVGGVALDVQAFVKSRKSQSALPGGRELQRWEEAEGAEEDLEQQSHVVGSWDQFDANKKLGVKMTEFDENMYTTPLPNMQNLTPEQRERAIRIARSLGDVAARDSLLNEQDLEDEEAAHAAVRDAGPPLPISVPSPYVLLANYPTGMAEEDLREIGATFGDLEGFKELSEPPQRSGWTAASVFHFKTRAEAESMVTELHGQETGGQILTARTVLPTQMGETPEKGWEVEVDGVAIDLRERTHSTAGKSAALRAVEDMESCVFGNALSWDQFAANKSLGVKVSDAFDDSAYTTALGQYTPDQLLEAQRLATAIGPSTRDSLLPSHGATEDEEDAHAAVLQSKPTVVFLRGIGDLAEGDLQELLSTRNLSGTIAVLPRPRHPPGAALVRFLKQEDAFVCVHWLDGLEVDDGRLLARIVPTVNPDAVKADAFLEEVDNVWADLTEFEGGAF